MLLSIPPYKSLGCPSFTSPTCNAYTLVSSTLFHMWSLYTSSFYHFERTVETRIIFNYLEDQHLHLPRSKWRLWSQYANKSGNDIEMSFRTCTARRSSLY